MAQKRLQLLATIYLGDPDGDALALRVSLPSGVYGVAYTGALIASGGTSPYTYAISSGSLPTGLSLDTSTGAVTGSPSAVGRFEFTAAVTDSAGSPATASQVVAVIIVSGIVFSQAFAQGEVGIAYSSGISAAGGTPPYTWTVPSGTLPTSLSIDSSTGIVSGTPSADGTFNFTVRATDSASNPQDFATSITIAAAVALSGTFPAGVVGLQYSAAPTLTGGVGPFTFAITSGAIPTGCSFASTSGTVSGICTAASTYAFDITVTDSLGGTDTSSQSVVFSDAGGGGGGAVESVTGTSPIVVDNTDPANPIVTHAASGVSAGSYGDSTHVPILDVDVDGHVTSATETTIDTSAGIAPFTYGDGQNGSFVLDGVNTYSGQFSLAGGVYTQLVDLFIQDMTITNGCVWNPNNWRWSIAGTLDASGGDTTNGVIQNRGTAGQNASGSTNGGRGAPNTNSATLAIAGLGGDGASGGTGAGAQGNQNQQNSQLVHMPFGGSGGAGSAGGNGSSSGAAGRARITLNRFPFGRPDYNVMIVASPSSGTFRGIGPGNGGCGGSSGGGGGAGNAGGGGAGGGGAGGTVWGCARNVVKFNGILINVAGQPGGNATNLTTGSNRGGGAGGSGGGGGWAIFTFSAMSGTGTMTVVATGGNGGDGGTGFGGGTNGTGGVGGDGGLIQIADVPAGTFLATIGSAGGSPSGTTHGTGGACTYTFP